MLVHATSLYNSNEVAAAAELATQLLAQDPHNAAALRILGVHQRQLRNLEAARKHLQHAIDAHPHDSGLRFELGVTLCEMHRTREALPHYLKAVELKPQFHPPHVNISAIYEQQEHYEQVVAWTRRALAIKPNCALSHYNLANALRELGRVEEAIEAYQRSIDLNPLYVKANWNLGLSYLLVGDYERGWPLFERRIELGEVGVDRYPYPLWQGESLAGKTLLVHAEQGLGDEILFASCFDEVIHRAANCVLVCEQRLETLFRRSFPQATVHGFTRRKDAEGMPLAEAIDVQIPAGSLPRYFRQQSHAFPQRTSFLTPREDLVAFWKNRLSQLGDGLKVGISWRAGGKPQERRKRMIPLDTWGEILTTPGVQFINLQYSDSQEELALVQQQLGVTIADWEEGDPLVDMDSFAAKIAALDLVIAVGNATVHVAGAVGTPAWTLLPMVPSWRWMVRGEQSPWYPSVKLYRQPRRGEWQPVLERVADDLRVQVNAPPLERTITTANDSINNPLLEADLPAFPPAFDLPTDDEQNWLDAKDTNAEVMLASISDTLQLGEQALASGNFTQAEQYFRDVLQIAPRQFQALHGLGMVARGTGRLDLAIRSFQRSLAMAEPIPQCHLHLGEALASVGRHTEAVPSYLRALELDPSLTAARQALAHAWQQLGDHRQALAELDKLAGHAANDARVLACRGVSLASECRIDEAIESLLAALRLAPDNLVALGALADVYLEEQRFDDAMQCLRRAIVLKPDAVTWQLQLARVLKRTGQSAEALEHMQQACCLDSDNRQLQAELARLHLELGEPSEAQVLLERVIMDEPHRDEWHHLLGLAHAEQGNLATALKYFDNCLSVAPDHAAARLERGKLLIQLGQLAAGWRQFALYAHPRSSMGLAQLNCPMWQGEPLAGRGVVLYADGGLQEELLFAACYPQVIAAAKDVTIVCHSRLAELFARSFPNAEIVRISRGQLSQWRPTKNYDLQIAASHLPQFFRRHAEQFTGIGYLQADESKRVGWQARLSANSMAPQIGIYWYPPEPTTDADRLRAWQAGWQSVLVALQSTGRRAICLHEPTENLSDNMPQELLALVSYPFAGSDAANLDQLAACLLALDLVITADCTVAHLAGALGVPTWALLKHPTPWYWLAHGDETRWHQSLRLYRQDGSRNWGKVFGRLHDDLLNRLGPPSEKSKGHIPAPHLPFVGKPAFTYQHQPN
jgi:tetratricopeptide (TPR) repeat protein